MLTIPLYIGWELAQNRTIKLLGQPLFRYKPDGDERREAIYRLTVIQLPDNIFKFIPVQDGYVTFTDSSGESIKSTLSYEGLKRILIDHQYLVLLAKKGRADKFKVFASVMAKDVSDERALKIACLKYIKEINVGETKHSVVKADTQVKKVYAWEDLAFRYRPQRSVGPAKPDAKKSAFDARNAKFYASTPVTGTKARYAELTRKDTLTKDEVKQLVRIVATAYNMDTDTIKLRFAKPVAKGNSVTLGLARGAFEDFFDSSGHRQSVITLMENSPHVILHEMSHVIAFKYYGRAEGGSHGDRFCGVYAHVLDQFCPYIVPHQAAAFMRNNGIKVAEFNPSAEPTRGLNIKSHRDFETSHAITAKVYQNRLISRVFQLRGNPVVA